MGVGSRRPPLPAPTDVSSADASVVGVSDDLATEVSRRTDHTSYSIPEDGRPVTITTKNTKDPKHSQTSLLIEYYEAHSSTRPERGPSVRVRVTPSSRRSKRGGEHIKISETNAAGGSARVRRISVPLPGKGEGEAADFSSASDLSSGGHPIEVDVLHNGSELSSSGGAPTRYIVPGSDISSMPAESVMDVPAAAIVSSKRRGGSRSEKKDVVETEKIKGSSGGSRGVTKERIIAQQVMEKLKRDGLRTRDSGKRRHSGGVERKSRSRSVSHENIVEDAKTSKSRSSKLRDDSRERNLHPSEISVVSSQSATSTTSINNPKLLSAVEEAVKRFILPEISALKEENQMLKNKSRFEENVRDSRVSSSSRSRGESKAVSKSSSLPNVSHNSESFSDDRVVTEESGRRRSSRRSSRGSEKSYDTTVHEESRRKVSREKDKNHLKEGLAAAAGLAVGVIAHKAMKHHGSSSSIDRERRRRRKSESGSRTSSRTESRSERRTDRVVDHEEEEEDSHNYIPPLPMQSTIGSDVTKMTRDSILSADTERPVSRSDLQPETPTKLIREVSRGSPLHVHSSEHVASTGSPTSFKEHRAEHSADSREVDEHASPRSSRSARMGFAAAALGAAAGAAAVATAARHADKHNIALDHAVSPIQSENSYLHERDDIAEHPRVRSIRSDNSMSSERRRRKSDSPVSAASSPTGIIRSKKRPDGISLEPAYEILPEDEFTAETPRADDFDQWLQREHAQNERYREELDRDSLVSRSDVDGYRDIDYTEDSRNGGLRINTIQDLKTVGANPEYVSTPEAAISAVASLQDPSMLSVRSSVKSLTFEDRPISQPNSYMEQDEFAANPTATSRLPGSDSKHHWEEVRDRYMAMTGGNDRDFVSPAQSETRSVDEKPVMHSSYVPVPGDMPDFTYGIRDEDDLQTNPSIVEGKLGEGIEMSPYPPQQHIGHDGSHHLRDAALLGTAAGVGLGLAQAAKKSADSMKEYSVGDDAEQFRNEAGTPKDLSGQVYSSSPAQNKDEGYISANPGGAMSPVPHPMEGEDLDDQYEDEFDDDMGMENPFLTQKHLRHESGLSHGMASPLYDSATGKGIDRIQSKDIVALMDHLTVRDAHRNARDTEILVTLVRSAAEMRNNFDEIRRFIIEQDRLIMNNMDRGHDLTVQRLGGPRPIPSSSSPRNRKAGSEDSEDLPTKRRNVLKRALKGLSMRSTNDLGKIEDMLMHLLQEVESLKTSQVLQGPSNPQTQTNSLNSYEHLRAAPDSGYEPEGRAGTNSSPAQSGHLSNNSSRHINGMHSGYGLRGSDGNRISTVLEGDEEGDEGARTPTGNNYAGKDSTTPPTNEITRSVPMETPPEQSAQFSADPTPKTDKSKSKHKSFASSLFGGVPKMSRWSKTTASTIPDSAPGSAKKDRPFSAGSRSGSDLNEYDGEDVEHMRSGEALSDDHNRMGSPLIPEDYYYDDPKYQAHRNSLNLQHPQPRPGPTHRHQNHLETQAMEYENPPTPDADQWGSAPALSMNKSRFSGTSSLARQSPIHSDDGYSQQSEELDAPHHQTKAVDDGPLIPQKVGQPSADQSYGMYGVPMMNTGMHIARSLAPIEEVRKSLETDRSSVRHEMTPSPRPTAMQSVQRKITGPREMPRSGSSGSAHRRIPVPTDSPVSFETYRTSLDGSETF